jgi:DNA-directed RNA polymerase specialized sigma24 family protein
MPADEPSSASAAAFDRLLLALDPDRDRAGLAYERLRARLIGLLEWWGAHHAEELADQTFDRVARKLEQGANVPSESIAAYVRGVARMMFHESRRAPSTQQLSEHDERPSIEETDEDEPALVCLDRCLDELAPAERTLVLGYYGSGKKADARQQLADAHHISLVALRIRTCRIRQRLEQCVSTCLGNTRNVFGRNGIHVDE